MSDSDNQTTNPAQSPPAPDASGAQAQEPSRGDELEHLQQELAEAQNQVLRAQAELDNFRKRTRREMEDERRFAAAPLLQDLLPALDNLQRALEASEKSGEATGLTQGVRMVFQQISQVLEQHGCRRIAAEGETFDPHLHEAMLQQPSDDKPAGAVLMEARSGYQLHDRVLRPAQVIVSAGPANKPE